MIGSPKVEGGSPAEDPVRHLLRGAFWRGAILGFIVGGSPSAVRLGLGLLDDEAPEVREMSAEELEGFIGDRAEFQVSGWELVGTGRVILSARKCE